ncbi:MAG: hypothetical protein HOP33_04445, partial [Verrucomicrobia bacterium]|nr:hypothetical protein [Verrucomicrobiota bacterium]
MNSRLLKILVLLLGGAMYSSAAPESSPDWSQVLEKDWLLEAQLHAEAQHAANLSTSDDAAGGCDGVTNGKWGFHTGLEANPWWQVDLGQV